MTFIAASVGLGTQATQDNEDKSGAFTWLASLGAQAVLATQEDVDAGRATTVGEPIALSTLTIDPPVEKLIFNNVNQPAPTPSDQITLREYEDGPMPQQDAEFNFINLTDRINNLIEATSAADTVLVDAVNSINTVIQGISSTMNQTSIDLATLTGTVEGFNVPSLSFDADTKTLTITQQS